MTSSDVRAPASALVSSCSWSDLSTRDLLLVVETTALERLGALPAHDQRSSAFLFIQHALPGKPDRHHPGDLAAHEEGDAQERRKRALL